MLLAGSTGSAPDSVEHPSHQSGETTKAASHCFVRENKLRLLLFSFFTCLYCCYPANLDQQFWTLKPEFSHWLCASYLDASTAKPWRKVTAASGRETSLQGIPGPPSQQRLVLLYLLPSLAKENTTRAQCPVRALELRLLQQHPACPCQPRAAQEESDDAPSRPEHRAAPSTGVSRPPGVQGSPNLDRELKDCCKEQVVVVLSPLNKQDVSRTCQTIPTVCSSVLMATPPRAGVRPTSPACANLMDHKIVHACT
ncbi:uncharacterized protein LOC119151484 isoform X2 [Falco rusticolus]|uniref:uncharacterized protein LOC119151484 isoform X2 n=1 Tax=Falco rusticolus TaxID=120794 RepID=UPI000FFB18F3|nr:uncharacterized protein LOC119151484 isoform X2 [Falco rusticolus]XP_037251344.1 uncharacterized protein LOC119151484 isoform X2 [Falco rusticolus]XP_037251346.1 uncharacterized protein LOC119151484 isoform X2 [Falco rusticolus]